MTVQNRLVSGPILIQLCYNQTTLFRGRINIFVKICRYDNETWISSGARFPNAPILCLFSLGGGAPGVSQNYSYFCAPGSLLVVLMGMVTRCGIGVWTKEAIYIHMQGPRIFTWKLFSGVLSFLFPKTNWSFLLFVVVFGIWSCLSNLRQLIQKHKVKRRLKNTSW